MTGIFLVDDSSKVRHETILGRYLLTALELNLKLSHHVIKADDGTFKGLTEPMVDLGTHEFKYLNIGNITPEESFTNVYAEEINESEQVHTSTKRLCVILDAKYEKPDLNKVMKNQCQDLIEIQCHELLKLLQTFEEFFDGTLGTWIKYPVELELNGCKADMFETISITGGKRRNI